jgi:hypothetical protein
MMAMLRVVLCKKKKEKKTLHAFGMTVKTTGFSTSLELITISFSFDNLPIVGFKLSVPADFQNVNFEFFKKQSLMAVVVSMA